MHAKSFIIYPPVVEFHKYFYKHKLQPQPNKLLHRSCYQNILDYLAIAVTYACKMFMKLRPGQTSNSTRF
jgi:hypothetical protein